MKAFVRERFGSPDRLELREIDKPEPGDGEVLVRVRATCVQPYDWHHLRGQPYVARLMGGIGLRRPKLTVLGADMAGEVAAIGKDVTGIDIGDEVYAMLEQGAFAEYVCAPAGELAPKPANLSFEQAAAVPVAANTALIGLRDRGRIRPGHKVLVIGASGGVGTFAVQLAAAFGAHVTAVCSARNAEQTRAIGADEVIDYAADDFTRDGRRYDLVLDVAGSRSAAACRRVMTRKGTYVVIGGRAGKWVQPVGHVVAAVAMSPFVPQRMVMSDTTACKQNRQNLMTLAGLIEDGKVTPVIDRTYPFEKIPVALAYQEEGHAPGKVVITL